MLVLEKKSRPQLLKIKHKIYISFMTTTSKPATW